LLAHPTLDQLHQLGLAGMAGAFTELEANPQSAELSHAEWLALLLDREATERYQRRLRARLRYARLRHQACIEDVDYRAARGLDRSLFQALIAGRWIEEAQNLIIEGPAGVGKSWLACALGQKACRDNRSMLYQRISRMFADLALARGDGRYPRLMRGGKLPPTQRSPMPSSPPALSATPIAPPKRAGNPSNGAAPTARASSPGGRVASGQAPQTVLTAHRLRSRLAPKWSATAATMFQMAEVAVPRQMFHDILRLIARLRTPPAPA